MDPHYYQVNVTWSRERRGMMCSPELNTSMENNCIEVATPPQFPKGIPGIWSPEHLFTASVSSCFMTTFLSIAENSRLNFLSFSCSSKGKLENVDGRPQMTEIQISPHVVIGSESDREKTVRILNKAEAACLITNSIKSKVIMQPAIEVNADPVKASPAQTIEIRP